MTPIFKKLLIPLCHSFILLPLAAIVTGSPAIGELTLLLLFLFGLSLIGWLINELLPHRLPVLLGMIILLGLGMLLGYTVLPDWFCSVTYGSNYGADALQNWTSGPEPVVGVILPWMAPVFGAISGVIMIWSQLECRRGLETGLPIFKLGIGLALYIFTYFSYRATGLYIAEDKSDLFQPIYLYGAIWLILALVIINYQFIIRMAASKNQPRPSRGVLFQNILLSLSIAGITILISCFGFLRNAFNRMLHQLAGFFANLSGMISEWMMSGPSSDAVETESEELYAPDPNTSEWLETFIMVIIWILAIAIACAALWMIGRKLWSLFLTLKKWMGEKLQQWQSRKPPIRRKRKILWVGISSEKNLGIALRSDASLWDVMKTNPIRKRKFAGSLPVCGIR